MGNLDSSGLVSSSACLLIPLILKTCLRVSQVCSDSLLFGYHCIHGMFPTLCVDSFPLTPSWLPAQACGCTVLCCSPRLVQCYDRPWQPHAGAPLSLRMPSIHGVACSTTNGIPDGNATPPLLTAASQCVWSSVPLCRGYGPSPVSATVPQATSFA
jgi:hypothetical protein